jgi:hypothetical protein
MPQKYRVEQGDYLATIAQKFGFTEYEAIWDDPRNAALKHKRKSPSILFPGDVLIIPDKAKKTESRAIDSSHSFAVPRQKVRLRIHLKDAEDESIGAAQFLLNVGGKPAHGTADGDGAIDEPIAAAESHVGMLTVLSGDRGVDIRLGIKVGDLNPLDEPSGQMARLNNLGYFAGTPSTGELMDLRKAGRQAEIDVLDEQRFRSAVEEFQCDHMGHAAVDGKCGEHTQAKLKQVYGC